MMFLTDTGRVPPGGWRHTEKDGMSFPIDNKTRIADLDQLVDQVKRHRQATDGDLGPGWRERFIDELCREHQGFPCQHEAPFLERTLTLSDGARFLNTAANFIQAGGKFVSQEEAERRAAICRRCPYNAEISGCIGCNGLMNFALDLISSKKTSVDSELKSCKNCACFLRLKVHVPLEVIDNDGVGPWPSHCWNSAIPENIPAA